MIFFKIDSLIGFLFHFLFFGLDDFNINWKDEEDVHSSTSVDKDAVKDLLEQQKKANQRRTSSLNYLNELKSFKLDENSENYSIKIIENFSNAIF